MNLQTKVGDIPTLKALCQEVAEIQDGSTRAAGSEATNDP